MREVILTASAEYFASDPNNVFGEEGNITVELFEQRAVDWLRREFGDDVIHAREDLDERAYHIHAIIMPRATVEMTRTSKKTGENASSRPAKCCSRPNSTSSAMTAATAKSMEKAAKEQQAAEKELAAALPGYLLTRTDEELAELFAGIEASVGKAARARIQRHNLRPPATDAILLRLLPPEDKPLN